MIERRASVGVSGCCAAAVMESAESAAAASTPERLRLPRGSGGSSRRLPNTRQEALDESLLPPLLLGSVSPLPVRVPSEAEDESCIDRAR